MKSHLTLLKKDESEKCYNSFNVQGLSDIILKVKLKTLTSRIVFISNLLKINITEQDYSSAYCNWEQIDRSLKEMKNILSLDQIKESLTELKYWRQTMGDFSDTRD